MLLSLPYFIDKESELEWSSVCPGLRDQQVGQARILTQVVWLKNLLQRSFFDSTLFAPKILYFLTLLIF